MHPYIASNTKIPFKYIQTNLLKSVAIQSKRIQFKIAMQCNRCKRCKMPCLCNVKFTWHCLLNYASFRKNKSKIHKWGMFHCRIAMSIFRAICFWNFSTGPLSVNKRTQHYLSKIYFFLLAVVVSFYCFIYARDKWNLSMNSTMQLTIHSFIHSPYIQKALLSTTTKSH